MTVSQESDQIEQTLPLRGVDAAQARRLAARLGHRSIVLVGMMGSGKSSVGKRLAQALEIRFVDADIEIEAAAGMSIPDIFATRGEEEFRIGERRVIARLLGKGPQVLATGGGAFMNAETRAAIAAQGISVWLKADQDVLMRRVRKRANRPLLQTADPDATMRALLAVREPVYALADITLQSREEPHEVMVASTIEAVNQWLDQEKASG